MKIKKRRNVAYLGSKYRMFEHLYPYFANLPLGAKVLDAFGGGANFSYCLYENRPYLNITYNELDENVFKYATRPYGQVEHNIWRNYLKDELGWLAFIDRRTIKLQNKIKEIKKQKEFYKKIQKDIKKYINQFGDVVIWWLYAMSFENGGNVVDKLSAGNFRKMEKFKPWNEQIKAQNYDFFDIDLSEYDIVYLDPPYFNSRSKKGYTNEENGNFFLEKLVQKLNNSNVKFVLSYYEDDFLDSNLKYIERKVINDQKQIGGKFTNTREVIYANFKN